MYTYTSNAQIQRQFDNINLAANMIINVSKDIITTESRINKTATDLNDNIKDIISRLGDIGSVQHDIKQCISNQNTELHNKKEIKTNPISAIEK